MKIKRFGEYYNNDDLLNDFIQNLQESSGGEKSEIEKRFEDEFGDKTPTTQDFAEFYHKLRSEGFDGIEIFQILDDKLPDDSDYSEDSDDLSKDSTYKRIEKKVLSDLKLDTSLVLTFGFGIGALYPIIDEMMQNMSVTNIDVSKTSVVLLTIAAITIIFLEEKKTKNTQQEETLIKDSKSLLEELRMRGIGDGIVKKVIKAINGVKNIFSTIAKHLGAAVGGVIDMFAYTAILIPIMNGIFYIIGKYDMGVDQVISNFFSLSTGVATRIAKHGLVELLDRLRKLISPSSKREIIDEIETPVIQKFGDIHYGDSESEQEGDLIKEQ
jgi:hypothetical protein